MGEIIKETINVDLSNLLNGLDKAIDIINGFANRAVPEERTYFQTDLNIGLKEKLELTDENIKLFDKRDKLPKELITPISFVEEDEKITDIYVLSIHRNKDLSRCEDCGYIGTDGYWKGIVETTEGIVDIEGEVFNDGFTFDLDPLIDKHVTNKDTILNFDGEAFCPKCKSENYY